MTSEMIHVAHHLYLRRLKILDPFVTLPTPDEWGRDSAQIHADRSRYRLDSRHREETIIKRTPLTRRTPLKRTPLRRKSKRRAVPSDVYQQVLARDMGCVGRSYLPFVSCYGRIDPHHVLRRSQGGQDTPDNLISLCRAHHSFVHDHPQQSYDLGLLKRPHTGDIQ